MPLLNFFGRWLSIIFFIACAANDPNIEWASKSNQIFLFCGSPLCDPTQKSNANDIFFCNWQCSGILSWSPIFLGSSRTKVGDFIVFKISGKSTGLSQAFPLALKASGGDRSPKYYQGWSEFSRSFAALDTLYRGAILWCFFSSVHKGFEKGIFCKRQLFLFWSFCGLLLVCC